MEQGIYIPSSGFHEFESAYDLWPERIAFFKKYKHELTCACRRDVPLPLTIVDGEDVQAHIRRLKDLDLHLLSCLFNKGLGAIQRGKDIYSPEIFDARMTSEVFDVGFGLLARAVVSRAYTNSFLETTTSDGAQSIYSGIMSLLGSEHRFISTGQSMASAAQRYGVEIMAGWMDEVIPPLANQPSSDGLWPITIAGSISSGVLSDYKYYEVPTKVLGQAVSRISVFGLPIVGPYLVLALRLRGSRMLSKVQLFPVALACGNMAVIDSDFERRITTGYFERGNRVYKALRTIEMNALPGYYRSAKQPDIAYRYRPDLLNLSGGIPEVIEICGFPDDPIYMQQLRRKEEYWRDLERRGHIRYRRIGAGNSNVGLSG